MHACVSSYCYRNTRWTLLGSVEHLRDPLVMTQQLSPEGCVSVHAAEVQEVVSAYHDSGEQAHAQRWLGDNAAQQQKQQQKQ